MVVTAVMFIALPPTQRSSRVTFIISTLGFCTPYVLGTEYFSYSSVVKFQHRDRGGLGESLGVNCFPGKSREAIPALAPKTPKRTVSAKPPDGSIVATHS